MTTTTDAALPEAGAHHLDGSLTPPSAAASQASAVDPEPPVPGVTDDLTTAGALADYALAKLRRYVVGSPGEISSHHIDLAIRLGELYERLDGAQVRRRQSQPTEVVVDKTPAQDGQFALDIAEDAQRAVEEAGG